MLCLFGRLHIEAGMRLSAAVVRVLGPDGNDASGSRASVTDANAALYAAAAAGLDP